MDYDRKLYRRVGGKYFPIKVTSLDLDYLESKLKKVIEWLEHLEWGTKLTPGEVIDKIKPPCSCSDTELSPIERVATKNWYSSCSMHGSGPKNKQWLKDNKWFTDEPSP